MRRVGRVFHRWESGGLFFGVDVELGVGDRNFVIFEGGDNGAEGITAGLKSTRWVASDDNLVIEGGGVKLSNSLVSSASDGGLVLEFFDDFVHDFFGFGDLELIG